MEPITRPAMEAAVTSVYANAGGPLTNNALYRQVAAHMGVQMDLFSAGRTGTHAGTSAGKDYSPAARNARWVQQTLKVKGLLERVEPGTWQLTAEGKKQLRRPLRGMMLLAFSTDLGLAVWGDCRDVTGGLEDNITLCLTSPCYPIANGRAYGKVAQTDYVDWLCSVLEGVVPRLVDGGNIALNIGQDVFQTGTPARSLFLERLTLALTDRFDLSLMDRLIWHNPNKPPGPVQWASKKRCQLNVGYEFVLWFTNNPETVIADNRRVLQPHTPRHARFMASGGTQSRVTGSDGAHTQRPGRSYAHVTPGKIPRNILSYSSSCGDQKAYKRAARKLGLPVHGAPAPLSLFRFLVRFLSQPGDLVFDPMAGSLTTAKAAQLEGRRWLASELYGEYLRGGAERFREGQAFRMSEALSEL